MCDYLKNAPKILYKYRNYSERSLEILEKNKIYFADPRTDFNDPFDCSAQDNMHDNFRDEVSRMIISQNENILPEEVSIEQIQKCRSKIDPELTESWKVIRDCMQELQKLRIFSLSERNDSILMWSHYADSHKGFCIGFSEKLWENEKYINKVIYLEKINKKFLYDSFVSNGLDEEEFDILLRQEYFLTKYHDWSYEKEWRLLGSSEFIEN